MRHLRVIRSFIRASFGDAGPSRISRQPGTARMKAR
jgi:hypothetical protein